MTEEGFSVTQAIDLRAILDTEYRPLSTRNIDELDRELAQLERKLVPLLNKVRAMRGKKPVIVPEG